MKQYITPKPNEKSERAADFFNEAIDALQNLYGRWMDEKDYENINDYKAVVDDITKDFGVTVIKMNKRPFGCDFTVDGRKFRLTIKGNGAVEYFKI